MGEREPQAVSLIAEAKHEEPVDLTVVLPAYNEQDTVARAYEEISSALDTARWSYELLFVDDGSTDGTWKALRDLAPRDDRIRALRHRANCGKAAALVTGFVYARGLTIAFCDTDLQYDPRDVVRVVEKLGSEFDAVSAEKVVRRDPLSKRLPSKIFNFVVRRSMHMQLHDVNAGLKAMRRDAANELVRYGYGGMHRYFMLILAKKGYRVGELPVESRPRPSGKSKYGFERYVRGGTDFLTVAFLTGYIDRPLNLFGGIAVLAAVIAAALALASLLFVSVNAGLLLQFAGLLLMTAMLLLVIGLVGELINNLSHIPVLRGDVSETIRVDRRRSSRGKPGLFVERRRHVHAEDLPPLRPSPGGWRPSATVRDGH